ncbi:MAG: GWxTD domain-containing protein [Cyclobacteriaceae bacterium]
MIRYFIFSLLLLTGFSSSAVDLTKLNLNYQINPYNGIEVQLSARADADSAYILYKISLGPQQKFDNIELRFLAQPALDTKSHKDITAQVKPRVLNQLFRGRISQVAVPNYAADSLVIIEVYDKRVGVSYFYETAVKTQYDFPLPKLSLTTVKGQPIIRDYSLTSDTFSVSTSSSKAYAYYYSFEFPPASPPMSKEKSPRAGRFKIDSVLELTSNQPFQLKKPGLYFLQTDSSSLTGRAHFIIAPSFPRYRDLESLMACTRYITTADEFKNIDRNPTKAAFDALWLDLAGSASKARALIRRYYNRIEEANTFFTSYKEGWKTDQGIIYTIYGTPDKLVKGPNFQQWYYDQDDFRSNVTFTFVKVKDLFSRDHYELLRNEKYAGIWFRSIEKWRTGR